MADEGFNIKDLLEPIGVTLNIPPFLSDILNKYMLVNEINLYFVCCLSSVICSLLQKVRQAVRKIKFMNFRSDFVKNPRIEFNFFYKQIF